MKKEKKLFLHFLTIVKVVHGFCNIGVKIFQALIKFYYLHCNNFRPRKTLLQGKTTYF